MRGKLTYNAGCCHAIDALLMEVEPRYLSLLCSNLETLEAERIAVQETLQGLGCYALGYGFSRHTAPYQLKLMLKALDDACFCVFILGNEYGAMASDGVSYLHHVYVRALASKKPVFSLIAGTAGTELPKRRSDDVRLTEFRSRLQQQPYAYFADIDELRYRLELWLDEFLQTDAVQPWLPQPAQPAQSPAAQQRFHYLVQQVQLLQRALDQHTATAQGYSKNASVLAGSQVLHFTCQVFSGGSLLFEEGEIRLNWSDLFKAVGAVLLEGAEDAAISAALVAVIEPRVKRQMLQQHPKAHAIAQLKLVHDNALQIRLALHARGLGHRRDGLWKLTPYGDHVLNQLAQA